MVVSQKYNMLDMKTGLLDHRAFADQDVYQDELERVFGLSWQFIGHESLIPNPNDFFLCYMGEDPVILTRDSKGEIHAFLNMCRHRGNRVVRADDGNAKNFMCTYHGWTFSNDGKLVSVPGLQEAYYGELDVEHLGLVPVAHLDTYAGFVFATWAEDAPSLEAYLGDVRWYLDTRYNRTDNGIQLVGPVKWIAPCNWKTPMDNASHDMYHGYTTHMASYIVQARFKGADMRTGMTASLRFNVPGQRSVHAGNGHSLTANIRPEGVGVTRLAQNRQQTDEGQRARIYTDAKQGEFIRRLGEHRATKLSGGGSVFPNKFLGPNLALPRGPFKCEVWAFIEYDKDTPQTVKDDIRRRSPQNGANHLAGTHAQDDMDNWRNVTEGGKSPIARRLARQNLSMGLRHEGANPDYPGVATSGKPISETGQRGFYARWQEFMNAGSWKDIHIDPITARFEGTATMRG